MTIETGAGADTVLGGPGDELISSGDDGDQVAPGAGDDIVFLGAADDATFQGDGRDSVDGQDGNDRLLAVGSADSEEFTVQGFDGTARVARDTGPATTDSIAVETLEVNAAGGQDLIDVGDLSASDVVALEGDLGFGDGARDDISVQGTDSSDSASAGLSGEEVRVLGLRSGSATRTRRRTGCRSSGAGARTRSPPSAHRMRGSGSRSTATPGTIS